MAFDKLFLSHFIATGNLYYSSTTFILFKVGIVRYTINRNICCLDDQKLKKDKKSWFIFAHGCPAPAATTVVWQDEGYSMKYSLSPREIPRSKPKGFPEGSGYVSSYFLTRVTIQTFLITNLALTFLGDQYWKNWFSVLLWLLGNTGKFCSVAWAILDR